MLKRPENELNPPPVSKNSQAHECLRVWCGTDMQQIALRTTWKDPGAWGLLLVDIARHAAKAYSAESDIPESEALERIKQLINAEWDSPTDDPEQVL